MRYSWQEYWSVLLCPPPGDLFDPMIKSASPEAPALQVNSLLLSHRGSSKHDGVAMLEDICNLQHISGLQH